MCRFLYIHDPNKRIAGIDITERMFCGLSVQQHGGQDGGGIAYVDDDDDGGSFVKVSKFFGLVGSQYDPNGDKGNPYRDTFAKLARSRAFKALGFLRYSTAGAANNLIHYPPQYIDELSVGRVVLAMNGDVPNLDKHRSELTSQGVEFYSQNDSEFMLRSHCHTMRCQGCTRVAALQKYMQAIPGAYSGVVMTKDKTYFVRDPWGFRPFVVGLIDGSIIVAASESCALDMLGAKFLFEVKRGEIIEVDDDGTMTHYDFPGPLPLHSAHCIFCLDYFASPVSKVFIDGRDIADVRQKGSYSFALGRQLAGEHPVSADFVASLPYSGDLAAIGYSEQSGLSFKAIFIRNIYVPRTFIMSQQQIREMFVRLKFALMSDVFRKPSHRRVCLVDDSIVRATTMQGIVEILREAGAEEIHLRISFPPITDPCFMGIAMPTKQELIASSMSVPEIQRHLKVDSLGYLSPEGVATVLKRRGDNIEDYCTACYSGKYPI
ncbi:MAG: amidophosphoribosyltransferase [Patescibacteria group bacterium]